MNDVAILHSPVGCAHCHPNGAIMARAEEVYSLDYFIAAPQWAQEGINEALSDFYSLNAPRFWTPRELKHIEACISCVKNVHRNCAKQEDVFGAPTHAQKVKRHKRTRAQIRAGKSTDKPKSDKKGGKK